MKIKALLHSAESLSDFFALFCQERAREKKYSSSRQIAEKMGYANPSLISDIINKKRRANLEFIHRFKKIQPLTRLEEQLLTNLLILDNVKLDDLRIEKTLENELIRKYWRHASRHPPALPRSLQKFLENNECRLASIQLPFMEKDLVKAHEIFKHACEQLSLLSMAHNYSSPAQVYLFANLILPVKISQNT